MLGWRSLIVAWIFFYWSCIRFISGTLWFVTRVPECQVDDNSNAYINTSESLISEMQNETGILRRYDIRYCSKGHSRYSWFMKENKVSDNLVRCFISSIFLCPLIRDSRPSRIYSREWDDFIKGLFVYSAYEE